MTQSLGPRPDFATPPVTEVALAVQFEPLALFRVAHMGLLWATFRDRFPKTEEHAPLEPVIEEFGVRHPFKVGVQLEVVDSPPVPRCWFLNEAGTELIQVQQDRFIHNWRRTNDGASYPSYTPIRETFERELRAFHGFVEQEGLGKVVPVQCEITYIDEIVASDVWSKHGQLDRVVTTWRMPNDPFLPEPESVRFDAHYLIPGMAGGPIGRLHINVQPAFRRTDDTPALILTMVARGKPDTHDTDGVLQFLDIGREWIVRGFAGVTTSVMHHIWGRSDDG